MIKVLLADDHKIVREGLKRIIQESGEMTVTAEASDGSEAIRKAMETRPDVAVVDISMPGMDGKEATQAIRVLESGESQVPIIAMTAHAMDGDDNVILAAGLDHYLTKPLRKADLVDHVSKARPEEARDPTP